MAQQAYMKVGHAVVVGGSIAGLLAARVLTNHFAQVTVVERDVFPAEPDFRKGAPHARHAHALLARGQQVMEGFFPGLTEELWAMGAIPFNMGSELSFAIGSIPVQPFATDMVVTASSRPLLEHTIRGRLQAMEQIRFLPGHDVVGITTDTGGSRATGVRVHAHGSKPSDSEQIAADLVVDASGRNSRLPSWLENLGYTPPTETTVDAQTSYTTRLYRRPPGTRSWQALYNIPQAPAQSRGCIIIPLEGDRWHVTTTGLNGDHPPTDEAGFLAFARSLPAAGFYAAIANAEPLTDPYGYRQAANRMRHYEKLPRYLEGVLALGDSVYALNPVYGQGMTVAALGAQTLDACLRAHRRRRNADDYTGLARRFQQRLAKVNTAPWQLATGQDLRWPAAAAEHKIDPMTQLMQRYIDRVLATMTNDGVVADAFTKVQNMVASPATLFHPRIVWRVLRTKRVPVASTIQQSTS